MKKVLLAVFTFAILGVQAQIFINTNPNVDKNIQKNENKTIVTPKVIPVEVTSTKTETVNPVRTEVKTTPSGSVKTTTTNVNSNPVEVKTTTTTTTPNKVEVKTVAPVTTTTSTTPVKTSTTTTTTTNYNTTSSSSTSNYKVAAGVSEDVPPNAEPGKCYARCLVEDKYDYVNETVIDQPKLIKQLKLPALYKTVYDTVVISPATTRKYTVPAEYETVREQVMVTPTTSKWVKGKADAGCLSANPADCQVMCLVEVPAVYKTVDKKILKNQAYTGQTTIPMQYKIVTREVLVESERIVQTETPATYKTVQKRVLVEKGGYQVWREILCGNDLTTDKIIQIQQALKAKGYNPGPIDDVFGPLTKSALIQYQKDKGLPVGNLNLETLRSLGL